MEFNLDPNWDHQLYFILSSPRSGSSVLRNKLNYLTAAVVLPSDTRIVEFIVLNQHLEVKDLKLKFKEYWDQKGFQSITESLWNAFLNHPTKTHKDVLGLLFIIWGLQKDKTIKKGSTWIEKSPIHLNYVEEIAEFYPKAKLIHLYRDPRSVVSSLNLRSWSTHNTYENALRWNKEQAKLALYTDFKVKYEALCENPKAVLLSVFQFLNYNAEEELDRLLSIDLSVDNPKIAEAGKVLNLENIAKFKKNFSIIDRDLEIVEYVCRNEMKQLGYEPIGKNTDKQFKKVLILKRLEHLILIVGRLIFR